MLKHLLAVTFHARNVTRRMGHERRLLLHSQGEPVVPFPGVLTEEVQSGLGVGEAGIEGRGLAGGPGGLQVGLHELE